MIFIKATLNLSDTLVEVKQHLRSSMKKFECIVRLGSETKKIIRYFSDSGYAFAWLELEGYKVISVKELLERDLRHI